MSDTNLHKKNTERDSIESMKLSSCSVQPFLSEISSQMSPLQDLVKPMIESATVLKELAEIINSTRPIVLQAFNEICLTYSEIAKLIPPSIEWLKSFDFSSIFLPLLNLDSDTSPIEELNTLYLMAMYECKWFPYAGWIADESLFKTVDEIIISSRGMSKRREGRIDKAILAYYTDNEIKRIKHNWRNSDLEHCLKKSLCQAIDAFLRKEYVLTISCLATMWEGLIYIKAHHALPEERHRQKMDITKQDLSELTIANNYDKIFSDYFENYIVSQCDKVADVVDGVPNRHGTSHCWYKNYPNKKAALNAILLTDFIINLKPKDSEAKND